MVGTLNIEKDNIKTKLLYYFHDLTYLNCRKKKNAFPPQFFIPLEDVFMHTLYILQPELFFISVCICTIEIDSISLRAIFKYFNTPNYF